LFSFVVLSEIRQSFQLKDQAFEFIVNSHPTAIDCYRNPNRDICSSVKPYINAVRNENELSTKCAINIINMIKYSNWDISNLNFQNGEIDTDIYKASPPEKIKEIKLSYNILLKEKVVTIPDNFIRYLNSCPFQYNDGITLSNCSTKLLNLCSSQITCVAAAPIKNPTTKNPVVTKTTNINPTNNKNDENKSNNKINQNNIINNKNNSTEINNDINNNNNNNNNNGLNTGDNNNNFKNNDITNNVPNDDNFDEKYNTGDSPKTLFETFIFGLLTSVGILGFAFLVLCVVQTYTHKNILNFKRVTYYEDRPLVKSNSSSMNESLSNFGTHSTNSNYNLSNSSQTSFSTKHKRYLYVFDDGSVMMSKSLQSSRVNPNSSFVTNNTINNSLNEANNSMNSKNSNNDNNILSSNSNLSISISSNPNNISNTTLSPLIGSPIMESNMKTYNKNVINISVPQNYVSNVNEPFSTAT